MNSAKSKALDLKASQRKLMAEIDRRANLFVAENYHDPTDMDFAIIRQAMIIGSIIVSEQQLEVEKKNRLRKQDNQLFSYIVLHTQGYGRTQIRNLSDKVRQQLNHLGYTIKIEPEGVYTITKE